MIEKFHNDVGSLFQSVSFDEIMIETFHNDVCSLFQSVGAALRKA